MKKFNICLVMAFLEEHMWKSQLNLRDNLGIGYLTSILRQNGFTVNIVNAELLFAKSQEVADSILKGDYQLVGFSCSAQRNYIPTIQILDIIRAGGYKGHVTIGGEFATTAHKEILNHCNEFDSVILGEGEYTIVELANAILEDKELHGISGLSFRDRKGQLHFNVRRSRITELDSLPFPSRDGITYYLDDVQTGELFCRLIAGRGCYGKCSFCSIRNLREGDRRRITRSPENVINEIEYLINTYKIYHFRFNDDIFYDSSKVSLEWINRFCELIRLKNLNIVFDICVRAQDVTFESISMLKSIGLNRVYIGVESGSSRVLTRLNKLCSVEENTKAMNVFSQISGLKVDLGFIMFEPEMDIQELEESFLWLKKFRGYASKHNIYNKLNIYYKTEVYYRLLEKKMLSYGEFWERHNYTFMDNRVERVLKSLEKLKSMMMPVNNLLIELKLLKREVKVRLDKGGNDEIYFLNEINNYLGNFEVIELDFWFEYFEKILEAVKGNNELCNIFEFANNEKENLINEILDFKSNMPYKLPYV